MTSRKEKEKKPAKSGPAKSAPAAPDGVAPEVSDQDPRSNTDFQPIPKDKQPSYVVGIGASAGGLEALEDLFTDMPLETGMAFVIVQHLSPDYKSMMDELLARRTFISVEVARDAVPVEANKIYLLPPNQEMIVANQRLFLSEREAGHTVNLPINTFFRSLAESYQDKAIAIVLSGTGSDGSKGVTVVHDNGGFVIAQNPDSCKFESMPERAIATGHVDTVLSPQAMPNTLVKYSKRTTNIHRQMELGNLDAEEGQFSEILILLNNRFDLDFSQYKPSTITRRLERRLAAQKVTSLKEYMGILITNEDELEILYFDLLIGVTRFFRDEKAFLSLRLTLAELLNELDDEEEFRTWILGCATGQEAYSMSMMIKEEIAKSKNPTRTYKIFATDIHRKSLMIAGAGIYKEDMMEGLNDDYKKRFFKSLRNGSYQVKPEIRSPILFAPQNILKDPPFTKMHMVSCRNVLIYFNAQAQQRVLSLLAFSLVNKGLLFLGPSESLGRHEVDFRVVDSVNRIMKKKRDSVTRPELTMTPRQNIRPMVKRVPEVQAREQLSSKGRKALDVLLQEYVPPSILLDAEGNVLHVFGEAGKYLSFDIGAASLNVRSMASGAAKTALSQMINYVNKNHSSVSSAAVRGFTGNDSIDIRMRPLSSTPADLDYILLTFEERMASDDSDDAVSLVTLAADSKAISDLEEELNFARENLQTTVEELESSNEELQASNEELMASNEELQSTNEELHSVNEELLTVNAEYRQKELQTQTLEADERSIIGTSGIGILFLDKNLRVRKFSSVAAKLFNIIDSDIGRPFAAVSSGIVEDVRDEITRVSRSGEERLIEREITTQDGGAYNVRITAHEELYDEQDQNDIKALPVNESPTSDQRRGVILTFSDVTKLRSLLSTALRSNTRLQASINAIADDYFEWNIDRDEFFSGDSFSQMFGHEAAQMSWSVLLGDQFPAFEKAVTTAEESDSVLEQVLRIETAGHDAQWVICRARILRNNSNARVLTGVLIDYTQHKEAEFRYQSQAKDLERSNQLLGQFAHIVSHDLKTPLRHIQNYLQFLQDAIKAGDKDKAAEEMAEIQANTTRLQGMIEDIITYSRVSSQTKNVAKVRLSEVINSVIEPLSMEIEEKAIDLSVSSLPDIEGDKTLLTQLFQNLIENAFKYNDKPNPSVKVEHEILGNSLRISIEDNGIGFDEAFLETMFLPFKRLVTKDKFDGSGLGLSIGKTIAELHQGTLTAESTKGEGSKFIVSLPLRQRG